MDAVWLTLGVIWLICLTVGILIIMKCIWTLLSNTSNIKSAQKATLTAGMCITDVAVLTVVGPLVLSTSPIIHSLISDYVDVKWTYCIAIDLQALLFIVMKLSVTALMAWFTYNLLFTDCLNSLQFNSKTNMSASGISTDKVKGMLQKLIYHCISIRTAVFVVIGYLFGLACLSMLEHHHFVPRISLGSLCMVESSLIMSGFSIPILVLIQIVAMLIGCITYRKHHSLPNIVHTADKTPGNWYQGCLSSEGTPVDNYQMKVHEPSKNTLDSVLQVADINQHVSDTKVDCSNLETHNGGTVRIHEISNNISTVTFTGKQCSGSCWVFGLTISSIWLPILQCLTIAVIGLDDAKLIHLVYVMIWLYTCTICGWSFLTSFLFN